MAHGTCDNCRFYKPDNEHAGVCRLKPPVYVTRDDQFMFPVVAVDGWCGCFERDNSTDLQKTRSY